MSGTHPRIAAQVRRALIAVATTAPVVIAIDTTGCSVHGPQQQVACAFLVLCPDPYSGNCWPSASDGGLDAQPTMDAGAHDASLGGG